MHRDRGSDGHRGRNDHRGSMSRSMSVPMPSVFPSMPKGDIVGNWLSLMSMSSGLMSTDVMGVFGEVSKVVPLWCSSKHGPHGKML
jgi:hypothetical protein